VFIDLMAIRAGACRFLPGSQRHQATWLGYPAPRDWPPSDYLLADRYHVRPGAESWYRKRCSAAHSYAVYGTAAVLCRRKSAASESNRHCYVRVACQQTAKFSAQLLDAWAKS